MKKFTVMWLLIFAVLFLYRQRFSQQIKTIKRFLEQIKPPKENSQPPNKTSRWKTTGMYQMLT